MKKLYASAALCGLLIAGIVALTGCEPAPPTTPEDKIAKIAQAIRMGTSATVAIGLVAIPNPEEATLTATEAARALDESVMPLLNGDEAGLIEGLRRILELKAFDDPKLEKVKLILETGLPLLESYLPENLADQQLEKLPADAKAYIVAFFTGAREGIANYLSTTKDFGKRSINYKDLREKLAK